MFCKSKIFLVKLTLSTAKQGQNRFVLTDFFSRGIFFMIFLLPCVDAAELA